MRRLTPLAILAAAAALVLSINGTSRASTSPITHVVVIFQENHSFDNVLGILCETRPVPCNGSSAAKVRNGTIITLGRTGDNSDPPLEHDLAGQTRAIDGGKMDSFGTLINCRGYNSKTLVGTYNGCFTQFTPSKIPALSTLANSFTVSDMTFEDGPLPSWGSHLELAASTLDGFRGSNPTSSKRLLWGCPDGKLTKWRASGSSVWLTVPDCVPAQAGSGAAAAEPPAVQNSPVPYVPTIMDRLDSAGDSWRIYAPDPGEPGYGWAICPSFAECEYSPQRADQVDPGQVLTDAGKGDLPNFSVVIPSDGNSQHNGFSMAVGDRYIAKVVSAIENGPDWTSTAIFITYDDCGCFYDHVTPPPGMGVRVPMVIVSPYAKAGGTDSNVASFNSILAFTEQNFSLPPLSSADANAYDYSGAFDYSQTPLPPVPLPEARVPASARHDFDPVPGDPT
ncbi:MAG TPA: alkaline phosphatase family protein [Acidimicrobiales bacterium]|nr:alkaline phosphatase family protein [Acidimicrobiales bacterium]